MVCSDSQAAVEFLNAYRASLSTNIEKSKSSNSRSDDVHQDDDPIIVNSIWILDCISSFSFLNLRSKQYQMQ